MSEFGLTFDGKVFQTVPEKEIESGAYPVVSWECQPGDCVVFYGKTLHGADGNYSQVNDRYYKFFQLDTFKKNLLDFRFRVI